MKDRQEGSEVLTAVSEGYDYCNSLTRDARLRQPSSTELQRHTRVPLTNISFCPVYIQTHRHVILHFTSRFFSVTVYFKETVGGIVTDPDLDTTKLEMTEQYAQRN